MDELKTAIEFDVDRQCVQQYAQHLQSHPDAVKKLVACGSAHERPVNEIVLDTPQRLASMPRKLVEGAEHLSIHVQPEVFSTKLSWSSYGAILGNRLRNASKLHSVAIVGRLSLMVLEQVLAFTPHLQALDLTQAFPLQEAALRMVGECPALRELRINLLGPDAGKRMQLLIRHVMARVPLHTVELAGCEGLTSGQHGDLFTSPSLQTLTIRHSMVPQLRTREIDYRWRVDPDHPRAYAVHGDGAFERTFDLHLVRRLHVARVRWLEAPIWAEGKRTIGRAK